MGPFTIDVKTGRVIRDLWKEEWERELRRYEAENGLTMKCSEIRGKA